MSRRIDGGYLTEFFSTDPRAPHFPGLIESLAGRFADLHASETEELASLAKHIEHIAQIVSMQQSFAKGRQHCEILDPNEILQAALAMNLPNEAMRHIAVHEELSQVPAINTSRHCVLQILINLVRNAKQALDEHRTGSPAITLRTFTDDGFVVFEVEDNGPGISQENQDRVFQHGFTTKDEGHGFGLHSAANSAQEMGGSLIVHSDGLGHGAKFILSLPVHKREENTSGDKTPDPQVQQRDEPAGVL